MKLFELWKAVDAEVMWGGDDLEGREVHNVVASDLMSDVLMMDVEQPLLLTSLVSDQSLRTADVVGAQGVLVANGKVPPPDMVALAKELGMPLARTSSRKFEASLALGKALGR